MKGNRRLFAWILAFALVVSTVPVLPAAAEETAAETTAAVETAAPVEETTAPVEETTAPTEETTVPTEAATAPTEETTASAEEITAPTAEMMAPTEEPTVPTEAVTKPSEETEGVSGEETVTAIAETYTQADQSDAHEEMEEIHVGESRTLTLQAGEQVSFSFTPKTAGGYVFRMPEGEYISEGKYGYTQDFRLCITKNGEYVGQWVGNDKQEGTYCEMEAGQEYILIAQNSWNAEQCLSGITATVYLDAYVRPQSFTLSKSGIMSLGATFYLHVENIMPEEAFLLDTDCFTWTVDNTEVISISPNPWPTRAEVTALKAGTATVTATLGDSISASCEVVVKAPEKIKPGQSKQLTLGQGEQASFTFTPKTTGKYVFYCPLFEGLEMDICKKDDHIGKSVTNDNYSGEYCTMEEGVEYTLTVSNDYRDTDVTGTVYFDVLQEATSFSLYISIGSVFPGGSFHVGVEDVLPGNAFVVDTVWTVSNESVASISYSHDGNAKFDVIGEGTATITSTASNGVSASYEITVETSEKWVSLGSKTVTLNPGDKTMFSFTPQTSGAYLFTNPYGASTNYRTFNLSILENGIDVVDSYVSNSSGQGVYCVMEAGTEYVLTVSNDFDTTLTADLFLEPYKEPKAISIELSQIYNGTAHPADHLNVGATIFYDIIAYPESEYAAGITLTSSDPSILSITKVRYGYNLSANKPGTVTITATTKGGITATREVTVRDGDPLLILDGADSTVDASNPLAIRIDGEIEKLDEVWVDGKKVDSPNYTVTKGSTIVTLHPEYLKTLKSGVHQMNVYFTDGWAATTFEITSAVLGDLNGDGKIAAIDAAMVYAAVNNKKVLTDEEFKAADVDGSGKIQAKDAAMVYAYVNNKLDKFPTEK